jgi:hypothetical protein
MTKEIFVMLARALFLAALFPITAATAAPSAAPPPSAGGFDQPSAKAEALSSSAPWWEKLVLFVGDDGGTKGCQYQTSLDPAASTECDVEDDSGPVAASSALPEQMTRITFERRFNPVASLADSEVAAGDTLLGKAVLALAIDKAGRVRGCKVVATGGTKPDYSCREATAEKFEASASTETKPLRVATLTILVYAHHEQIA